MDERCITKKYNNGITAIYIPMKSDLIYIMFCHRVGMIHEENKEDVECAHFLEHLLAEFTSKKYPDALKNRVLIEDLGGTFSAHVTEKETTYYITARKEHFSKLMDLIGNAYLNFYIDKSIFEQERNAVTEELNDVRSETWNNFEEKVIKFLFPNSPVSNTTANSIENMKYLQDKDIYNFKNRYYSAHNTVLVVAGGVSENKMKLESEKFLSKVETNETPNLKKTEFKKLDSPSILFVKTPTDTYNIKIIFRHDFEFDSKDIAVLETINTILTYGMSSRLMEILRGKEGLIYKIDVEVESNPYFPEMGTLTIDTKTEKKNVQKVINTILKELKKLKSKLLSKQEYKRIMEIHNTEMAVSKTDRNPEKFAQKYSENILFQKPLETFGRMDKMYKSITRKDIKDISKKIFNFNEFLVAYSGTSKIKLKI